LAAALSLFRFRRPSRKEDILEIEIEHSQLIWLWLSPYSIADTALTYGPILLYVAFKKNYLSVSKLNKFNGPLGIPIFDTHYFYLTVNNVLLAELKLAARH
jgi:hypothetical protein